MKRSCLSFVLTAAVLAGCKTTVAPLLKDLPAPSVAGTGWTAAFDPESGVSLALPPGWRAGIPRGVMPGALTEGGATNPNPLDPSIVGTASAAGGDMLNALEKQEAELEKKTLASLREKEGIVLHCVDGSRTLPAEEPTRFFVKKIPDAGYGTLADAVSAEKAAAHREMKGDAVELPVGKAWRLQAKGRNRIGDEECHVSYVFVNGSDGYVLRFASTNNPSVILDIDRSVAQTFRVKAKAAK